MELNVWSNQHHVGVLSHDAQGTYAFEYSQAWLVNPARFALSPSLPLNPTEEQKAGQGATVRSFFQNLLPEGQALEAAAELYQISKANVPGLLNAIGREMAGSLVITASEAGAVEERKPPRHLPREEISKRIQERPVLPFSVWDNKVRLSIPGLQDKLVVVDIEGEWYLSESPNLASTHILKPEPLHERFPSLTTNELMCMRLAKKVGIPVAKVHLEHVPEPVLVIERFDRRRDDQDRDFIRRFHCIDGCQLLGLSVEFKYERAYGDGEDVKDRRDGASINKLFSAVNDKSLFTVPGAAQLALLDWVIFQVLIGNTDAHGKNISFFSDVEGLKLTPAYDLVCTLAYEGSNIIHSLAMAIGDNFDARSVRAYDWALMTHECQLPVKLVERRLVSIAKKLLEVLPAVMEDVKAEGGNEDMVKRVAAVVVPQCEIAIGCASEISQIDRAFLE